MKVPCWNQFCKELIEIEMDNGWASCACDKCGVRCLGRDSVKKILGDWYANTHFDLVVVWEDVQEKGLQG
jgi:hypothetical protein